MKAWFWKWVKRMVDKYYPQAYSLPTSYPDVNWEDNAVRDEIIMENMKTVGHAMLLYFRVCKLQSHMECMIIDQVANERFILSFKKDDGTHRAPSKSLKIIE